MGGLFGGKPDMSGYYTNLQKQEESLAKKEAQLAKELESRRKLMGRNMTTRTLFNTVLGIDQRIAQALPNQQENMT